MRFVVLTCCALMAVTAPVAAQTEQQPDSTLRKAWAVFLGCSEVHSAKKKALLPLLIETRAAHLAGTKATENLLDAVSDGRVRIASLPRPVQLSLDVQGRIADAALVEREANTDALAANANEVAALVLVRRELLRLGLVGTDPAPCPAELAASINHSPGP